MRDMIGSLSLTGSPIAEILARVGVAELLLIDPDTLEPSNARRVFGVTSDDARRGEPKVRAVAHGLKQLDLGARVTSVIGDVREPDVHGYHPGSAHTLSNCVTGSAADGRALPNFKYQRSSEVILNNDVRGYRPSPSY